jgi:hypothetical protein
MHDQKLRVTPGGRSSVATDKRDGLRALYAWLPCKERCGLSCIGSVLLLYIFYRLCIHIQRNTLLEM